MKCSKDSIICKSCVSNTMSGEESIRPDMTLRPERGWVDKTKGPTSDVFDTLCCLLLTN